MFKLAAAALVCALLLSLLARRRGGAHWVRFALASFGFFALITASFWILSPDGTARTVQADASGTLMLQIVQGRGAVVLPFGLAALAAAAIWPKYRLAAMLGPLAYNALMTLEATRVQFTSLATPERWLYVSLHGFWAITLAIYCSGLDRRRQNGIAIATGIAIGAIPVLVGMTLYLAPLSLLDAVARTVPTALLVHAAHAFGASLTALGLTSFSYWAGHSWRVGRGVCVMAATVLACLAVAGDYWPAAAIAFAWGLIHLGSPRALSSASQPASHT